MQSYDSKQQQHYYHKFSRGTILGVTQTRITFSPMCHATDMLYCGNYVLVMHIFVI